MREGQREPTIGESTSRRRWKITQGGRSTTVENHAGWTFGQARPEWRTGTGRYMPKPIVDVSVRLFFI